MISLRERVAGLQLSYDDVKRENPSWSDEMVRDYLSKTEAILMIADAVEGMRQEILEPSQGLAEEGIEGELSPLDARVESPISEDAFHLDTQDALAIEEVLFHQVFDSNDNFAYARLTYSFSHIFGSTQSISNLADVESKGLSIRLNDITFKDSGVYTFAIVGNVSSNLTGNVSVNIIINNVLFYSVLVSINTISDTEGMAFIIPITFNAGDVLRFTVSNPSGGASRSVDITEGNITLVRNG